MKPTIKLVLFLFCALNFRICSGQSWNYETARKADSVISIYSNPNAPGMGIGIIKDAKILYKKTYGLANLEDKIPVSDATAFDIASVSKQFTAFVVLLAEQEGKLSLEDDIRTYLPELKNLPYKISIRQLANHTHGLPDFTSIKRLQGFGDEFRVTNDQAVKTVLAIKSITFKPGDAYKYNNTGFMLLAEILHRIYKKEFREIIKEYIFTPLKMNHTMAIDDPQKIIPNRAESYQENGGIFLKYPLGQMENGSSNIFTTLDDFCIWAMNYQKPIVGNRELYNKMQQSTLLNTGERVEYGLGLQTGRYKGLDIVFHGGGTAGYRSYILHVPAYHLSIVLAGNRSAFDGLFIAYKLVDVLLGDRQVISPLPPTKNYNSSQLKEWTGMYEINPGNYLDISTDGKNLYQGESKMPLTATGDLTFAIPAIPTASVTFKNEGLTFNVGDFSFFCKKVILAPQKGVLINLHQLTGFYKNEEFNTIYQLFTDGDKLIARHSVNPDVSLYPLHPLKFYSYKSFFGQLDFKRDKNGNITGFLLAGANMSNIEFKKIK